MESVIKQQGLAAWLDALSAKDAIAVVVMLALGSEEDKAKLAEAFAQQMEGK